MANILICRHFANLDFNTGCLIMSQQDIRSPFGRKKAGGGDDKTKTVLFEYLTVFISIPEHI